MLLEHQFNMNEQAVVSEVRQIILDYVRVRKTYCVAQDRILYSRRHFTAKV